MLTYMYVAPVTIFFLAFGTLAVTADFVSDLEETEKEMKEDTSVVNEALKESVEAHLRKFYANICHLGEGNNSFEDFFTLTPKLNYAGQPITPGSRAIQKTRDELQYECHLDYYKIWNIEIHSNTAITLTSGKSQRLTPNAVPFVEIMELTWKESIGWRIDAALLFEHVNFSANVEDIEDVRDHVDKFYAEMCTENQRKTMKMDLTEDVMLNIAGKHTTGEKGLFEEAKDMAPKKCAILDHRIIEVEMDPSGNSALVLITGHGRADDIVHPFVEVFELRKTEKGWKTDMKWLFIHVEMPQ